jgi:hypothetical protein
MILCLWLTFTASVSIVFFLGRIFVSLVLGFGCFGTTTLVVVPLSSSGV